MPNIKDNFSDFKSGFVAIVGAPNVGKSTLLNQLLGDKISITSKKPQTTRNRILGVVHRPSSQIILIDTPGIHKATRWFRVSRERARQIQGRVISKMRAALQSNNLQPTAA